MQDYYEEQVWKDYPGIWSVLAWVVKNISVSSRVTLCNSTDSTITLVLHCVQPDGYEDILLIPPMMTLLDDYQAKHKLKGVRIVSLMLHTIPQRTLLRTGVHELISCVSPLLSSDVHASTLQVTQNRPLSRLSDPETPTLIISTWLNLAFKVDEPNSLELFDHLSVLVGTGIIKGTNTKHRSYEGHIGRITQPVENTWHSYGQFSQGTFYLSDSMSRNQLSQKFSRSYLNSRI